MPSIDFARHNEEVEQVWEAYHAGRPLRTPMTLATNPRIWVQDPALNQDGVTWEKFCTDPEVMFQTCLKYKDHLVHNLPFDAPMGVPAEHWTLDIVFGNVIEEAWFGAEIIYPQDQVSATVPCYSGEQKWKVFEQDVPGSFGGIMGQLKAFYEYFVDRAAAYEYRGRPVRVSLPSPLGTDGPLTIANGIRGSELFEDMLRDEDYYHRLMSLITDATIQRIRDWRRYAGIELQPRQGYLADDAIQFLSVKVYREKVLPYHKQILEALWGEGPHFMHLCGNVQRHFPTLVQELNVKGFDTGYPIRFETLRDEIGEDVEIQGGIQVADLVSGTPENVFRKSAEILSSGIRRGNRFIFKEANNLPPMVPIPNLAAMYAATKEYGKFNANSRP